MKFVSSEIESLFLNWTNNLSNINEEVITQQAKNMPNVEKG